MSITLMINGEEHRIDAAPGTPLLWVLRDHLGLTGTKFGCGVAQCGACTVHVNGEPVRSCSTPHDSLEGQKIETIEARAGAVADAVRSAWIEAQAPQCGYCQSGQIMAAIALLESNPNPDDDAIDTAMAGNICRCGTYLRIRDAIKRAAASI